MDGDTIKTDGVIVVDAPELGTHVVLVEGNVGDALMLMDKAAGMPRYEFLMLTLSISLRIDGKPVTLEQIKAMPGSKLKALLRIAPKAVELNQFFESVADDEEDPEPKS